METEKIKAKVGKLYDANYDTELLKERAICADIILRSNRICSTRLRVRFRYTCSILKAIQMAAYIRYNRFRR